MKEPISKSGIRFFSYWESGTNEDLLLTPAICIVTNGMVRSPKHYVFAIGIKWGYWNIGLYFLRKIKGE